MRPWTLEEDETLKRPDLTARQVAKALKRTVSAVYLRREKLGIKGPRAEYPKRTRKRPPQFDPVTSLTIERKVIAVRFRLLGLTVTETAAFLGVSGAAVSRMIKDVRQRLGA